MQTIAEILARELDKPLAHVQNVIDLLDQGNTIPFIARYRKELHGSMDDTALRTLEDRLSYLRNLDQRRQEVKNAIDGQGKLTDELSAAIDSAATLAEVEDLYRPYKQKRRTRATVAREKGLEPLALLLLDQGRDCPAPEEAARDYVDPEKGVETLADALQGANDIVAELLSDDAAIRKTLRELLRRLRSLAATEEDTVYRLYYDFDQPIAKLAGHQVLAINRGEKEGVLSVTVLLDRELGLMTLRRAVVRPGSRAMEFIKAACEDAYTRLIAPSLDTELRNDLTDKAQQAAIHVFALNLKPLLMQPPVKGKVAMGLDPGYRMGCKVAVVDPTGKVLDTNVVYPVPEFKRVDQAKKTIKSMVLKNEVEVMAIGNGTAGHETEEFAAAVIRELAEEKGLHLQYMVVSEAGASVYSASKLAAEEFPQYDVNLRSAVSIARRLQDPLAELVKIDPKAVGVGQYQHDMPQKRLNETLDGVVEDCVNSVGVDLNTASAPLLARVAGITNATAKNIVAWREEEGAFTSRAQLKKVKGLGPKAFEQCAGFLRLPGAKNPLDATAVHPESYPAAKGLLEACGCDAKEIGTDAMQSLPVRVKSHGTKALCEALGVGEPTLMDIVSELCKPGRDVRDSLPKPLLRSDVMGLEDLKPGMELKGTVRNVIDFGAFVDIGVHQDGLVHVSQISDKFIKNPRDALKVGDVVQVKVLSVDTAKKRIALTMKGVPQS